MMDKAHFQFFSVYSASSCKHSVARGSQAMDWETLYCPHRHCRGYGKPFSQGYLVKNGTSRGQPRAWCTAEFIPLSFWYDAPRYHHIVTGGTTHGWFAVHRPTVPSDGVPGFHQPDARRVSAAGPALRDRIPSPDGGVAHGWEAADRAPVYRVQKLPSADAGRSALLPAHLPQDL